MCSARIGCMAHLTPAQNGIHSLAKALEAFDMLIGEEDNVYYLKDAVLRTHHSIETIFKSILFEHNPVLILRKEIKVEQFLKRYEENIEGKNQFIVDEEITVGLSEALARLKKLGILNSLSEAEFQAFKVNLDDLENLRNGLQHFAVEVNSAVVIRRLGTTIPRFVKLVEEIARQPHMSYERGYRSISHQYTAIELTDLIGNLSKLYAPSSDTLSKIKYKYDDLIVSSIAYFSEKIFNAINLRLEIRSIGGDTPELTASGLINISASRWSTNNYSRGGESKQILKSYEGKIIVEQPKKGSAFDHEYHDDIEIEGVIKLNSSIDLSNISPDTFGFELESEYLTVLRDFSIAISAEIEYSGIGMYNSYHFDVRNNINIQGKLKLTINSVPYGSQQETKGHIIVGSYDSILNSSNTGIRLHSFVEPDGRISSRHSLDWTSNICSDLIFEKVK